MKIPAIEELKLHISDPRTKVSMDEVLSSFYSGNMRSAIVMLYATVVSDLYYKIRDLVDIYNELSKVDVLFISHFHRDHINQVTKLPITKETKVFIPWLYNPYILLKVYLYNMEYTSLVNWLKQNATVIFIDPFQIGGNHSLSAIEEYDPEKEEYILPIVNLSDGQHVNPLLRISVPDFEWCYIPFHLQDNTVFDFFINEAFKAGFAKEKLENFDVEDKPFVRKVCRLYKKVCKQFFGAENLNYSTMLLASRRLNSTNYSYWQATECFWKHCYHPYRYDGRLFESTTVH